MPMRIERCSADADVNHADVDHADVDVDVDADADVDVDVDVDVKSIMPIDVIVMTSHCTISRSRFYYCCIVDVVTMISEFKFKKSLLKLV